MWLKLEARLNRNPELSFEYHDFLRKYLELGHMEPVTTTDSELDPAYVYIPHLPVVRDSSSTTRVRVVFNASSPTSYGTSLNDHLLIGPKLQNDLPSIVLRWRMHRYAFTADVQQMYRQIRVDSRDTKYQCILWREHCNQPMTAFRLLTVTYGTVSAPYQALRVLKQLGKHPSHWKTFVANRVSEVLTTLPEASWRHVPTASNPADCASRGISVRELLDHTLWWKGPAWLREHSTAWPSRSSPVAPEVDLEQRVVVSGHAATQNEQAWDLHYAISSWPRLLRVTAYCMRFVDAIKTKANRHASIALTACEIAQARLYWVRFAQAEAFSKELEALHRHRPLPSKTLSKLNPVLDKDNVLRVGGRLKNSLLSYDEKHPIILPQHRVSELICAQAHLRALHGGTQLTMRLIRQSYWVLGVRHLVKKQIHRCVPCIRERAAVPTQLMADLPQSRATPSRPFSHCGVDYAGPILVRMSKGRGSKANKGYIAVFVCFATRAIHVEVVSDYTSSAFIAAFERFVSRRGLPSHMYSDNGTTFQGAERELRQAFKQLASDPDLANYLASDGITWKFLPPVAPHFGGLWEAGVKSVKHHLKRILGSHTLTFEEITTLLYQIESCLNSRPIAPMTNDPSDCAVLTPGHFLIGAPLRSVPQPSLLDVAENRLSRYQLVRRMYEQFWRIWSNDYLHSLQQRNKWSTDRPNLAVDDLVLLRNDNLPPSKWQLARVIACHPGADGHTRVVTVKTAASVFKRPITKLCTLPIRTANP